MRVQFASSQRGRLELSRCFFQECWCLAPRLVIAVTSRWRDPWRTCLVWGAGDGMERSSTVDLKRPIDLVQLTGSIGANANLQAGQLGHLSTTKVSRVGYPYHLWYRVFLQLGSRSTWLVCGDTRSVGTVRPCRGTSWPANFVNGLGSSFHCRCCFAGGFPPAVFVLQGPGGLPVHAHWISPGHVRVQLAVTLVGSSHAYHASLGLRRRPLHARLFPRVGDRRRCEPHHRHLGAFK